MAPPDHVEAHLLAAAEVDNVDKSAASDITEEVISAEKLFEAEDVPDDTVNVAPSD